MHDSVAKEDLQTHRSNSGLSQSQYADWLGVAKSTLAKWETGANKIPRWVKNAITSKDISGEGRWRALLLKDDGDFEFSPFANSFIGLATTAESTWPYTAAACRRWTIERLCIVVYLDPRRK